MKDMEVKQLERCCVADGRQIDTGESPRVGRSEL